MPAASAPSISPGDYAGEMFPAAGDPADNPLGYKHLWTAVILRSVQDATIEDAQIEASKSRDNITADFEPILKDACEAVPWLFGYSEDFQEVCAMAGLNPRFILDKAALALAPCAPKYEQWANALAIKAKAARDNFPCWPAFDKARTDRHMVGGYDPECGKTREGYMRDAYFVFQKKNGLPITGHYDRACGRALATRIEKKAMEGLQSCSKWALTLSIELHAGLARWRGNQEEGGLKWQRGLK